MTCQRTTVIYHKISPSSMLWGIKNWPIFKGDFFRGLRYYVSMEKTIEPIRMTKEEMKKSVAGFYKELEREGLAGEYAAKQAELIKGFEDRLRIKLYNTNDDPEWIKRDMAFYHSTHEIYDAVDEMPLEVKRCLSADIFALHYLLTNGRLDGLIAALPRKPVEPEKLEDLRVKLAWRFLEKIRGIHREKEMAKSRYRVTLGIELEIDNDGVLAQGKTRGETPDEAVALAFSVSSAQTTGKYGSHRTVNRPESSLTSSLEIVSTPLRSVALQLLQIRFLLKPERLGGDTTYHITFGGVDITPEHTEVMDLQALALACGWMEKFSDSGGQYVEGVKKASNINGRPYYFPHFRRREEDKLGNYGGFKTGVEFRFNSKCPLTDEWYGNFAKHLTFEDYGCIAIKAAQKEASKRDETEKILAEKWKELMGSWEKLLGEHDLASPEPCGKYVEILNETDLKKTDVPYELFLGKISKTGFDYQEFSIEAKALAEKFSEGIERVLEMAEKG